MNIYIDESGSFSVPKSGLIDFCCVGALIIPEAHQSYLFGRFQAFRARCNANNGEVKGHSLVEDQIAEVIELPYLNCLKIMPMFWIILNAQHFVSEQQNG